MRNSSFTQQHRSLKALRKLLIAFRAAVHMNEDDQVVAWSISSSAGVYPLAVSQSRLRRSII